MERIGLTASKIAKGNLVLYNTYVIVISITVAFFLFLISGAAILFAMILLGYIFNGVTSSNFLNEWGGVISVCMIGLTVVVGLFSLVAIIRNIKISN